MRKSTVNIYEEVPRTHRTEFLGEAKSYDFILLSVGN